MNISPELLKDLFNLKQQQNLIKQYGDGLQQAILSYNQQAKRTEVSSVYDWTTDCRNDIKNAIQKLYDDTAAHVLTESNRLLREYNDVPDAGPQAFLEEIGQAGQEVQEAVNKLNTIYSDWYKLAQCKIIY